MQRVSLCESHSLHPFGRGVSDVPQRHTPAAHLLHSTSSGLLFVQRLAIPLAGPLVTFPNPHSSLLGRFSGSLPSAGPGPLPGRSQPLQNLNLSVLSRAERFKFSFMHRSRGLVPPNLVRDFRRGLSDLFLVGTAASVLEACPTTRRINIATVVSSATPSEQHTPPTAATEYSFYKGSENFPKNSLRRQNCPAMHYRINMASP